VSVINLAATDKCDVLSICWGNDEQTWQSKSPGVAAMIEAAAQTATAAGMTIFAAAGDSSSSDADTGTNVDLPASCPHVIGCGGTSKTISSETVWGDGVATDPGTGGGFSAIFPVQSFQIGAPIAPAGLGRMVPDIAADADPNTGVIIFQGGSEVLIGGTSVVAPLYAGLFAALGKQLGFVTPTLWLNPTAFVDVTSGSNGAYSAAVGPDPCSGLGTPNGQAIAAVFGKTITPPPPVTSDITATFSSGTLTIQGNDDSSNLIVRLHSRKTILEVEGRLGTTINGGKSYSVPVSGSFALNVVLGAGNDEIAFHGVSTESTNSIVELGAGNDRATFLLCDIGILDIDGGTGTNHLFTLASKFETLNETNFVNPPRRRTSRNRR
jgi:subtilase family serine protease